MTNVKIFLKVNTSDQNPVLDEHILLLLLLLLLLYIISVKKQSHKYGFSARQILRIVSIMCPYVRNFPRTKKVPHNV